MAQSVADTISALRRYIFDYAVGLVWMVDLLLVVPSMLRAIAKGAETLNTTFNHIKAPEQVLIFYFALPAVVVPYAVGLLGTALASVLFQKLQQLDARRVPKELQQAVKRAIEDAIGVEIDTRDIGPASTIYLAQRHNDLVRLVVAQADDRRFRRMLLLPFVILAIAGTCRIADNPWTIGAGVGAAIGAFAIFLMIELKTNDPAWKQFYFAVLMSRRRPHDASGHTK